MIHFIFLIVIQMADLQAAFGKFAISKKPDATTKEVVKFFTDAGQIKKYNSNSLDTAFSAVKTKGKT